MTPKQVKHALKRRDLSIKDFAVREGFNEVTVRSVIKRYAGKNRRIYGMTTFRICTRLSQLLGKPICQGITRPENLL